ncbi:unnamed protein product [Caenorhabditis sp. 36 PRJEB53466]|nr:unnamed protein product [Caenorhabditis sp. 36 PRJEB53466]
MVIHACVAHQVHQNEPILEKSRGSCKLVVSGLGLTTIPNLVLKNRDYIEVLHIDNNFLTENSFNMPKFYNLRELSVNNNKIRHIGQFIHNLEKYCPNLEILYMANNPGWTSELEKQGSRMISDSSSLKMTSKDGNGASELRLNVTNFYNDQETRHLLLSEQAARTFNRDDSDPEFVGERIYEKCVFPCVIGSSVWRVSRSSMLALSLFCTIAVAVIVIAIVLLCTFITLSSSSEIPDDITNEDVIGVINWLHYPIGDLALRRTNYTKPHQK